MPKSVVFNSVADRDGRRAMSIRSRLDDLVGVPCALQKMRESLMKSITSIKTTKYYAIALLITLVLITVRISNRNNKQLSACGRNDALCHALTSEPNRHSLPVEPPTWMTSAGDSVSPATLLGSAHALGNFTIVTAFLNIGKFAKGELTNTRDSSTYLNWMQPYRLIQNGVVAYFDDSSMAAAFTELRQGLPTKVIMVDRSKMWAFSLVNRTSVVFSDPDYPKNYPKSTSAEYVAVMHAKYELLARTVREEDSFGSTYIAWMDLGIYRELRSEANATFMLRVNRCLHNEAVMFARIFSMDNGHTQQDVMRFGHDWVGGGFFVARRVVMTQFCEEYARRVESFLNQSLANHDQSVLLAMYLPGSAPRPSVPLQAIIPSGEDDPWFYMALQFRRDALEASSGGLQLSDGASSPSVAQRVSCTYEVYT